MRKTKKHEQAEGKRVLARLLAEDLKNIEGGVGQVEITMDDGHGHRDMTNFPNDGYN